MKKFTDISGQKPRIVYLYEAKHTHLQVGKKVKKVKKTFPYGIISSFLFFLSISFLAIFSSISYGQDIYEKAQAAFGDIKNASINLEKSNFREAANSFSEAKKSLEAIEENFIIENLSALQEEENLITFSIKSLDLLQNISLKIENSKSLLDDFIKNGEGEGLITWSEDILLDIQKAKAMMNQVAEEIDYLLSSPASIFFQKKDLIYFRDLNEKAQKEIMKFEEILMTLPTILGKNGIIRTAVFFQNTGEIRATGGFPGSLAIITASNGQVNFEFFDIYQFEWDNGTQYPPPPGFERLVKRLTLQDSNYLFDFPSSAAIMRNMIEESGGPTVDNIVIVNDTVLADILAEAGSLRLPDSEEKLSQQNSSFLLSFFVEAKISGRDKPKNILLEILPELKVRLSLLPNKNIINIIEKAIVNKDILAHSQKENLETLFSNLNMTGQIKANQYSDYLAVNSANVGGNKSDHFITEKIFLTTAINLQKQCFNELEIERQHNWGKNEEEFFDYLFAKYGSQSLVGEVLLKNILGKGANHSYSKIYVPLGSQLISAQGVSMTDIITSEENDKTVFAFRFPAVYSGESEKVSINYQLPENICIDNGELNLLFQKQSGRDDTKVSREILTEEGIRLLSPKISSALANQDLLFLGKISF